MIYLYLVSLSFSFSLVLLLSTGIYLNYRQSSLMLFHTKYNGCEHCRENGMFCGLYLFIFLMKFPHICYIRSKRKERFLFLFYSLSVQLLLSVAYSPSVTWLFLFNSFVGQAYKWERVPCPLLLFLWAGKLVLIVYNYIEYKSFIFTSRKQRKRYIVTGRKILVFSSSTDT